MYLPQITTLINRKLQGRIVKIIYVVFKYLIACAKNISNIYLLVSNNNTVPKREIKLKYILNTKFPPL